MSDDIKPNENDMVTWELPYSLIVQIEALFEEQHNDNETVKARDVSEKKSTCYKYKGAYYCKKWVNGVLLTYGPYLHCPPSCK